VKGLKRLGIYLLINVIVSAATTLLVLMLWSRNQVPAALDPAPTTPPTDVQQAVGQGGEALEVAEPTATLPVGEAVAGLLEITNVVGAGDLTTERIMIRHVGDQELSLAGWQLQDSDGHTYRFPALTMYKDGAVTVFTKEGPSSVVELYWGLGDPVWESGEIATLLDPAENVQASYTVP
jgi:hypothetical protein